MGRARDQRRAWDRRAKRKAREVLEGVWGLSGPSHKMFGIYARTLSPCSCFLCSSPNKRATIRNCRIEAKRSIAEQVKEM